MSKLSDRVRPDVEAASWVIEEIERLEAQLAKVKAENERLHEGMDHYRNQLAKAAKLAPGSGRVN
jgi:hypothetical protein